MSSSNLLSIGTSALAANMAALRVTGNNIANVNTPGYSRQSAMLQSSGGQTSGSGFFGKGVDVVSVERAHSDYLSRQAVLTQSISAADAARSEKLALVEPIFASGANGIGASINNTLNAFADVASMPTDLSARQVVLSNANEMAARFREASARLDQVGQGLNEELKLAVNEVNTRATQIAKINDQIASLKGTGQAPNDLLDQRDQLISEVNKYVLTTTVAAPDGTVGLFVGGTQPLVLAGHAMKMSTAPDTFDPSRLAINIQTTSGTAAINDAQLSGGSIAGMLKFQRTDLPQARDLLGRMALATATLANDQNHLGLDLKGNPGGDLFKLPAVPAGLPASTNLGNATVGLGVVDPTAFVASDYELQFNAGQVDVVRLSDGQSTSFASLPAQLDGLSISVAAGAASVGDRFLLRPFSQAASSITTAVSAPSALAVSSPVVGTAAGANKGDVSVTKLLAIQADPNTGATVTLTFNGSGGFDVTGTGTGNPTGVPFVPGQSIQYNGWSLNLAGTPQAGDTITIKAATSGARNADQASGFLALRDKPVFDGVALSDGYASVLSQVGARVQAAQLASDVSKSMATQASQSEAGVSGVNLDEEAARLLQYQQSYQAAAKILQVAQGMFDSLLQGLGR